MLAHTRSAFVRFLSATFVVALSWQQLARSQEASTSPSQDAEKIRQLEQRVAQLEQSVSELKALMGAGTNSPGALDTATATANPAAQPAPSQPLVSQPAKRHFEMPAELIPDVGKIGAEVGMFVSGSSSPFKLAGGSFNGGYIDLPLFDRPRWLRGKVSYEIVVGLTRSSTRFNTTSNVAQVANLAVLNAVNPGGGRENLTQAVSGSGAAPFPVTVATDTRLRLLQVIPFALRYTPTVLDRYRLRPYAVAGFGTYVTIHVQNPVNDNPAGFGVRQNASLPPDALSAVTALFGGKAPFGGPLVAGQISQAAELEARGLPGGHGNLDFGYQAGGGLSFRITGGLSLGFDARYNRVLGSQGSFVTYGSRIGVHF